LRVLIDESLPVELADQLTGHEAVTVHRQGWLQFKNSFLLRRAVSEGFTIIVTGDQKLRYQQNLRKIGIGAVVVTRVRNRIEDLRPLIPRIVEAIEKTGPGEVTEISPS
jgi:rRNA-processing protein FCF1